MTHVVEKPSEPAIPSTSSSSSAPEGSLQNNNIIKGDSVPGPPAPLKQEKGWKGEEKVWKGVSNKSPIQNQTKYKEEYGYIVTNQR